MAVTAMLVDSSPHRDGARAPASAAAGLPRYRQIANSLRDRIHRREWQAGERLPGEEVLAGHFGVSKLTMRQALGVLLNEGLIRREHGKGTFVTDLWHPTTKLTYTSRMEEVFGTQSSHLRLLDANLVSGPWSDFADLGVPPGSSAFRLRRVHLLDERPRAYVVSYLLPELGQRLEPADLVRAPFILAVESRLGLHFPQARQMISASLADEETAAHLEVPLGSAVLLVQRSYLLAEGKPGYVAHFRYPGGHFRYEVPITRVGEAGTHYWTTPSSTREGEAL